MALTKISTDTIDLSSDTTALKMPKGTTSDVRPSPVVTYLVVAGGGGGGGYSNAGGGGGGGLLTNYGTSTLSLQTDVAYTVTVGAGGAGGANSDGAIAGQGGNSKFDTIEATGGGGGVAYATNSSTPGGSGGSGGGGGYNSQPGGAASPSGQGNAGGAGAGAGGYYPAGGGGGAGAVGGTPANNLSYGNGGDGLEVNIIGGTGNYYAGGGGGCLGGGGVGPSSGPGGAGGAGGGGQGRNDDIGPGLPVAATAGTDGLGGGGGGASGTNVVSGGSGVVIIRYSASFAGKVTLSGITGVVDQAVSGSSDLYAKATGVGTGTLTFASSSVTVGTMRENTTTGKMEIYTGAKGWRALQQTGQDVGIVPSNGFGTALYTGNGGADDISLNFQPDLIWIKGRDTNGKFNAVYDSVRGATNMISTNSTDYGTWNPYGSVTPNHAGFAIGSASAGDINTNTENYVSWSWKAGGNSNTFNIDGVGYATAAAAGMNAGSISPNACSVSTEYGFSITKYDSGICGTSNPPCFNWSHGLNQEPDFVTNKMLNYSYGWDTIFKPAGYNGGSNTGGWQYAQLNTNAAMSSSPHYSADSTLLYETMSSGASYPLVTYAWHSVPGYSLISTYTGTGISTAMPRIYTGFQPAWLMVKRLDSTGWWNIEDSTRNTSNPRDRVLGANSSDAEIISSSYNINFYNDGFQIINNHADWNAAGGEYLFLCFAS